MAKRVSFAGNVTKVDDAAKRAAGVAKAISARTKPAPEVAETPEYETVSYNLPLHLIDLYRDLATERHRIDQAHKRGLRREMRAAKKAGLPPPMEAPAQARQSASAIVREAMEAYADQVRKELESLRGK
jgi:hypothetical protein